MFVLLLLGIAWSTCWDAACGDELAQQHSIASGDTPVADHASPEPHDGLEVFLTSEEVFTFASRVERAKRPSSLRLATMMPAADVYHPPRCG